MPSNPWHPAMPTSAKARRMLRPSSDGHALALTVGAATIHAVHASSVPEINEDARFIIGTVAAELCHEMALDDVRNMKDLTWGAIHNQWRKWANGEAWQ